MLKNKEHLKMDFTYFIFSYLLGLVTLPTVAVFIEMKHHDDEEIENENPID